MKRRQVGHLCGIVATLCTIAGIAIPQDGAPGTAQNVAWGLLLAGVAGFLAAGALGPRLWWIGPLLEVLFLAFGWLLFYAAWH